MKKEHYYQTARMSQTCSLEHLRGQFVKVIRYHKINDTFSIRAIDGELQCMVERGNFESFCL